MKICQVKYFLNILKGTLNVAVPFVARTLLPTLESVDRLAIYDLIQQPRDAMMVKNITRRFAFFEPANPTGHYDLNLSNPTERTVGERVLALNFWHQTRMAVLDIPDTSRLGDRIFFRNCKIGRLSLDMTLDTVLPFADMFSFDYASPIRMPMKTKPLKDKLFDKLLKTLDDSDCGANNKLRAIHSVSAKIALTAQQILQIVLQFPISDDCKTLQRTLRAAVQRKNTTLLKEKAAAKVSGKNIKSKANNPFEDIDDEGVRVQIQNEEKDSPIEERYHPYPIQPVISWHTHSRTLQNFHHG